MGERKAHRPLMAELLLTLNWDAIPEAMPTPNIDVSDDSLRAAESVEKGARQLQED